MRRPLHVVLPAMPCLSRCLPALLLVLASGAVVAQSSGGDYQLKRAAVTSGGGRSLGAGNVVQGTIAQSVASGSLTGGTFTLTGGIREAAERGPNIFANGFE